MKKYFFILVILAFMLSHGKAFSQDTIPYPCTPAEDPCTEPWLSPPGMISYTIPGTNCVIYIYHSFRICPIDQYEIQILNIDTYGNCIGYSEIDLLRISFMALIQTYHQFVGWPPQIDSCFDYFYFSLASCFVTLDYSHMNLPPPWTNLNKVLIPCSNAGCCEQQIRVCKGEKGRLTFLSIGAPIGSSQCDSAEWPDFAWLMKTGQIPPCPPYCPSESNCLPTCNALTINDSIDSLPAIKRKTTDVINQNSKDIDISITLENQILSTNIETNKPISLIIRINDILGNEVANYDFGNITGLVIRKIDISKLYPGTYLINFYNDNKLIKTEKFFVFK